MSYNISIESLENELKTMDYSILAYDDNELKIKRISRVSIFIIFMMSLVGIVLMFLSYVSIFVIANPEYFAGVILLISGLIIVLLPVYNYYSKKYFEIDLNKTKKYIGIKSLDPLPVSTKIPFDEIESLHIKKTKLNSSVSYQTKGSYVFIYTISLNLINKSQKELIRFSKRDEKVESFSIDFTNLLIELTGKNRLIEAVNA
jgi:hypothetical protein